MSNTHTNRRYQRRRPSPLQRSLAALCAVTLLQLHLPGALTGGHWIQPATASSYVSHSMVVLLVRGKGRSTSKNAIKTAALERLFSRQLRRLEQVRSFELSPVAGGKIVAQVEKLVEEALRALLLRTPQRATERLRAVKALLDKTPSAGDARVWARMFKALGLVALARNQLVAARDLVLRSMTLFPSQTTAEYVAYGEQATLLFDTVLKARQVAPKGDLAIGKAANGAEVWLTGVSKGTAPTKLEDLPAGDHRLTLRRSGFNAIRRFVRVTPGKTVTVNDALKPASFQQDLDAGRKVLKVNFRQPSIVEDRIRELRNEIGTDQIMVLKASFPRGNTVLKGYVLLADGTFKKLKKTIKRDENYLDNAAQFLADSVGTKVTPDPEQQPLDERKSVVVATKNRASATDAYIDPNAQLFQEEKSAEIPLTKKWWFWAAIGGGVAVIGTVVGLLASGDAAGALGATGTVKINLNKASQ
ncbi:MAG: hypothetical protein CMH53_05540 [Myxococcales bacterium]|nr:hypothetical protein [Myxococcales bacterium]